MSLSSELKNPSSHISTWVAQNFDLTVPLSELLVQTKTFAPTIRPTQHPPYPWATVGHAVELRMNQAMGLSYKDTPAPYGIGGKVRQLGLHDALNVLWTEFSREKDTSAANAWLLFYAGLFEGFYYGGIPPHWEDHYFEAWRLLETSSDWMLFHFAVQQDAASLRLRDHPCLLDLPSIFPLDAHITSDIVRVADATLTSESWAELMAESGDICACPVFTGSAWVNGADGDFVVNHRLYDVKTTLDPRRVLPPGLVQLLCYAALDTDNEYEIEDLILYFPRQSGSVARVSLDTVLEYSAFANAAEMRRSLAALLAPQGTVTMLSQI